MPALTRGRQRGVRKAWIPGRPSVYRRSAGCRTPRGDPAAALLAGLTACRRPVEKIVPYVNAPEEVLPGVPRHFATTMPFGRTAYGLVVESHEGRPTKVEGNELHPTTRGVSSAWMQATILDLYDPDRSQAPRFRDEKRTWEDFETKWAELETAFLSNGGPNEARLLTGEVLLELSQRQRAPVVPHRLGDGSDQHTRMRPRLQRQWLGARVHCR